MAAPNWPELAPTRRPTLKTPRLILSAPSMDDAQGLVAAANDYEVVRWLERLPHPYTAADAAFFIQEVSPREVTYVVRTVDGGAIVGAVSLKPLSQEVADIGYWLGRCAWGKGFGTEAVAAVVQMGVQRIGLTEIGATVFKGNTASIRVLEKLGFSFHGRRQGFSRVLNEPVEELRYCLLNGFGSF
ncbi:MAG: GNAT family N-acetyltransferase [Pseudomonadota bacterium]